MTGENEKQLWLKQFTVLFLRLFMDFQTVLYKISSNFTLLYETTPVVCTNKVLNENIQFLHLTQFPQNVAAVDCVSRGELSVVLQCMYARTRTRPQQHTRTHERVDPVINLRFTV